MQESNFYNRYFLLFSIFCLEILWSGASQDNYDKLIIDFWPITKDISRFYLLTGAFFAIISPIFGLSISTCVTLFSKVFGILSFSPYPLERKIKQENYSRFLKVCDYLRKNLFSYSDIERDQQKLENVVCSLEMHSGGRDWIRRRIDIMHLDANIIVTVILSFIVIWTDPLDYELKMSCLQILLNFVLIFVFAFAACNSSLEYRNRLHFLYKEKNQILSGENSTIQKKDNE